MGLNQERIYHVYLKTTGELFRHSLTVDDLESMIKDEVINFSQHEIVVLTEDPKCDPSY
jgi:hypothetical protein